MKNITCAAALLIGITTSVSGQEVIPLYNDTIPNNTVAAMNETDKPTLTVYFPAKEKANGTAIVIFPGGA